MGSGKPKQFTRPPKKQKPKAVDPETVDDFQEIADFEENAGGKHRAGDPAKSGRAFVRALDVYDKGLHKHPNSFDLAYNKARLQFEISQQPVLVEHLGIPLVDWLQLALASHRYALRLKEDNADTLFNTAQVLSSLAELLSEADRSSEATALLHESLELLSACLSRQEMMYEQHRSDFPDTEDGGVSLNPDGVPSPPSDTDVSEQSVVVETPVSPGDLLDTVHASLSALTTLASLTDPAGLQTLGDMAQALTEVKAPNYLGLLLPDDQASARLDLALGRANFVAAFANSQFENHMIEFETYVARLDTFDFSSKDGHASALCSEAEARKELVLTAMDRFSESPDLPAVLCWKQLSTAQDVLTKAAKLTTEDAQDRMAETYTSKGDVEMLRYRLASSPNTNLSESIRRSARTLVQNAQKFYKGGSQYAKRDGDDELDEKAAGRYLLASCIESPLKGGGSSKLSAPLAVMESCINEGLISESLAQALVHGSFASGS